MLPKLGLLALFAAACCFSLTLAEPRGNRSEIAREKRLLSVFNIVKFPNDPCGGSSNQNGTCYTEQECEDRDGTPQGTCAEGYGVCCVFSLGCGKISRENTTYFASAGGEIGTCKMEICKCDSNICQLRLDFNTFVISGPSTSTISTIKSVTTDVGTGSTRASMCLTDTFTVNNPGGIAPPVICGTNTGEHMYVDASEECNDLIFQLGQAGVGAGLVANRNWNVKVTQYSCDYDNLAPSGCTQWFFGSSSGVLQNYNSAGRHLANQNQNMCIRQERNMCRICYFTSIAAEDFRISGATAMGKVNSLECCHYGAAGAGLLYDCVTIPGAFKSEKTASNIDNHFCGLFFVKSTGATANDATICTESTPFNLRFLSDGTEVLADAIAAATNQVEGFRLNYAMSSTCGV